MSTSPPPALPIYTTALIGRSTQVSAVLTLLRDDGCRFITLVGASGAGKTRLSLQIAQAVDTDFPDGVVFIALAPVDDPELVLPTIAQAVGIREQGTTPLLDLLAAALQQRQCFLILDNFEQVRDAAPEIAALVNATERLSILITSQVALEVPEETVFIVPPLALPQRSNQPPAELLRFSAIALFVDRLQAVQPLFVLTPQNAAAVVEICTRVQGLPLAIDLIAAHSSTIKPVDLLLLLRNYLPLPKQPGVGLSRDHILNPVLTWCYRTLPADAQRVFARLALFTGGCTMEAAAAICTLADESLSLPAMMRLFVEKHLLLEEGLVGHEIRYVMLDAIRDFALQRQSDDPLLPLVRQQYTAYYRHLALEAAQAIRGPHQLAWLTQLESEHHNLRAALSRVLAAADADTVLELAGALGRFWLIRGHLREGRRWCTAALAVAGGTAALRGNVLHALGVLVMAQGELATARSVFAESRGVLQATNDHRQLAVLGGNMGILEARQGDLERANAHFEESLVHWRAVDDSLGIATTLGNLGVNAMEVGAYDRAETVLEEALARWRAIGQQRATAIVLQNLAQIAGKRGDGGKALALFEESLATLRIVGDPRVLGETLTFYSHVLMEQQEFGRARVIVEESLRIQHQHGARLGMADALVALAALCSQEGAHERAGRLLGAADTLCDTMESPLTAVVRRQHDEVATACRRVLGEERAATARAYGAALALDDAVTLALGDASAA